MLGKVTVWYMTEEERLAYIEKHPIIATEKPTGAALVNITEMARKNAVENIKKDRSKIKKIDKIDRVLLQKLFVSKIPIVEIAKKLNVSESVIYNIIREERELNPEKWPYKKPRK